MSNKRKREIERALARGWRVAPEDPSWDWVAEATAGFMWANAAVCVVVAFCKYAL